MLAWVRVKPQGFANGSNPLCWTVRDRDAMPDDSGWKRDEIVIAVAMGNRAAASQKASLELAVHP
jgi:hypothetical protein